MQLKTKIAIILFCLAVAVVGSGFVYAYYNDTQTASNNTFASGTLLLQVGTTVPCTAQISVANMKPGDTGNAANWQIQNLGTISGDLNIQAGAVTNNENGVNAAEVAAGEQAGNAIGDMGGNLTVALWMDADHSGTWSSGDYYLKNDGTIVSWASGTGLPAAAYASLNSYGGKTWANVQTNVSAGTIGYFRAEYSLPAATTNWVQGDSSTFAITFTLNQH